MQKVENYPHLRRVESGCYVNTSTTEYQKALARNKTQERISSLENRLTKIENLLETLINLQTKSK